MSFNTTNSKNGQHPRNSKQTKIVDSLQKSIPNIMVVHKNNRVFLDTINTSKKFSLLENTEDIELLENFNINSIGKRLYKKKFIFLCSMIISVLNLEDKVIKKMAMESLKKIFDTNLSLNVADINNDSDDEDDNVDDDNNNDKEEEEEEEPQFKRFFSLEESKRFLKNLKKKEKTISVQNENEEHLINSINDMLFLNFESIIGVNVFKSYNIKLFTLQTVIIVIEKIIYLINLSNNNNNNNNNNSNNNNNNNNDIHNNINSNNDDDDFVTKYLEDFTDSLFNFDRKIKSVLDFTKSFYSETFEKLKDKKMVVNFYIYDDINEDEEEDYDELIGDDVEVIPRRTKRINNDIMKKLFIGDVKLINNDFDFMIKYIFSIQRAFPETKKIHNNLRNNNSDNDNNYFPFKSKKQKMSLKVKNEIIKNKEKKYVLDVNTHKGEEEESKKSSSSSSSSSSESSSISGVDEFNHEYFLMDQVKNRFSTKKFKNFKSRFLLLSTLFSYVTKLKSERGQQSNNNTKTSDLTKTIQRKVYIKTNLKYCVKFMHKLIEEKNDKKFSDNEKMELNAILYLPEFFYFNQDSFLFSIKKCEVKKISCEYDEENFKKDCVDSLSEILKGDCIDLKRYLNYVNIFKRVESSKAIFNQEFIDTELRKEYEHENDFHGEEEKEEEEEEEEKEKEKEEEDKNQNTLNHLHEAIKVFNQKTNSPHQSKTKKRKSKSHSSKRSKRRRIKEKK